ncbi:MAG: PIN domain-containing protein [Oscillospiraceae bacterium]|jgi:uncharacterized protein YacL|nr:PIN domain-containing protein [Oscillospiraceae bacterium]
MKKLRLQCKELYIAWLTRFNDRLDSMTVSQTSCAVVCMMIAFALCFAASLPWRLILPSVLWKTASLVALSLSIYTGYRYGSSHWGELLSFIRRSGRRSAFTNPQTFHASDKLLDTNVIIDGRIFDAVSTGFIEGALVIPQFVLQELRKLADSNDPMRSASGKRGIDNMANAQDNDGVSILIDDSMMELSDTMTNDADVLLLKLAKERGGSVVTNDTNLIQSAQIVGVRVLIVNDLLNALRPSLSAGDERSIQIVREGREAGQGVGYLDDGTIVFVENAKQYIGETVRAVVARIHHTTTGRIAFARLR